MEIWNNADVLRVVLQYSDLATIISCSNTSINSSEWICSLISHIYLTRQSTSNFSWNHSIVRSLLSARLTSIAISLPFYTATDLFDRVECLPDTLETVLIQCSAITPCLESMLSLIRRSLQMRKLKNLKVFGIEFGFSMQFWFDLIAELKECPQLTRIETFEVFSAQECRYFLNNTWSNLEVIDIGSLHNSFVDEDSFQVFCFILLEVKTSRFPNLRSFKLSVAGFQEVYEFISAMISVGRDCPPEEEFIGSRIERLDIEVEQVTAVTAIELGQQWNELYRTLLDSNRNLSNGLFPNLQYFHVNHWLPSPLFLRLLCNFTHRSSSNTGLKGLQCHWCPGAEDPSTVSFLTYQLPSMKNSINGIHFRPRRPMWNKIQESTQSEQWKHLTVLDYSSEYDDVDFIEDFPRHEYFDHFPVYDAIWKSLTADCFDAVTELGLDFGFLDYLHRNEDLELLNWREKLPMVTSLFIYFDCKARMIYDLERNLLDILRITEAFVLAFFRSNQRQETVGKVSIHLKIDDRQFFNSCKAHFDKTHPRFNSSLEKNSVLILDLTGWTSERYYVEGDIS